MYQPVPYSPVTEISAAIGAGDTTVTVDDGALLGDAPNIATIGASADVSETIAYGDKNGNILSNVQRGIQGTAKSWSAGDPIARNFTALDQTNIQDNIKALNTVLSVQNTDISITCNITDLQSIINGLPKIINANVTIIVNPGVWNNILTINRFQGTGSLTINNDGDAAARTLTAISITECSLIRINVGNFTLTGSVSDTAIELHQNTGLIDVHGHVSTLAGVVGIRATNCHSAVLQNNAMHNKTIAYRSYWNARMLMNNNTFDGYTNYTLQADYQGTIHVNPALPAGTAINERVGGVIFQPGGVVRKTGDKMTGALNISGTANPPIAFTRTSSYSDIWHSDTALSLRKLAGASNSNLRSQLNLYSPGSGGTVAAGSLTLSAYNESSALTGTYNIWGNHNFPVASGSFTFTLSGTNTAGSYTLTQNNRYYRFGNLCHLSINVKISTVNTAGAGDAKFTGLPFNATQNWIDGAYNVQSNYTGASSISYPFVGNVMYVRNNSAGNGAQIAVTSFSANTMIYAQAVYRIA
jgi:uncharacterized protein YcfL